MGRFYNKTLTENTFPAQNQTIVPTCWGEAVYFTCLYGTWCAFKHSVYKHIYGINQWKIRLVCFFFYTNRFLTFIITTEFWSQSDTRIHLSLKKKEGSDIFEYLSEDTEIILSDPQAVSQCKDKRTVISVLSLHIPGVQRSRLFNKRLLRR